MTSPRLATQGLCAVVTGGTKGIGRAIVTTLAAHGAHVLFQGRDAAAARSLELECEPLAGEARFMQGDLHSFDDSCSLVQAAVDWRGRLDVFVSSGGSREPRPCLFEDLRSPDDSFAVLQSRLGPRLVGLHAALPQMKSQGGGKIILLGTDAARTPTPGESMIGAAGAVVMFLTRALGKEFARHGVRINTVATTLTADTPAYEAWTAARSRGSAEVLDKAFGRIGERVGFRLNTPQDIADYVLFLASPASDQISGSTLSINGGLSFPAY